MRTRHLKHTRGQGGKLKTHEQALKTHEQASTASQTKTTESNSKVTEESCMRYERERQLINATDHAISGTNKRRKCKYVRTRHLKHTRGQAMAYGQIVTTVNNSTAAEDSYIIDDCSL